jgi:uncharacterized protein (DUF4415 family)
MNVKLKNIAKEWVDPDDAPEITAEDLKRGIWAINGKVVSEKEGREAFAKKLRGRPVGSVSKSPKKLTTIRLSAEVIGQFKAAGAGWQTKIDLALKDWLLTHQP